MILRDGIFYASLLQEQPVIHGFTTRRWGNLGFGKNPGDPDVIANRKALWEKLGLADRIQIQPRQIHSVIIIHELEFVPGIAADGVFGNSPQNVFSVLTADCVPILLYHADGIVGTLHAGWRGLYDGIIPTALSRLPQQIYAALGPAIGSCCYEVGEDLATKFEQKFGDAIVVRSGEKPRLDLVQIAILQLLESGVEQMEAAHLCTACHPDLFFSYRRDGSSGRIMSFIGLTTETQRHGGITEF